MNLESFNWVLDRFFGIIFLICTAISIFMTNSISNTTLWYVLLTVYFFLSVDINDLKDKLNGYVP